MILLHEERLQGLRPEVVHFCQIAALIVPWNVLIVSGRRTDAQQAVLYAEGRTAPGRICTRAEQACDTAHGRGAAVDLAPVVDGIPDWKDASKYQELADIAEANGFTWGGRWPGLRDMDHFELSNWRDLPVDFT